MSNVEKLLIDEGISYKSAGKDYIIACLNPDHDDKNPSLRLDKVTGVAHCFACGWKRNLFRHFGKLTSGVETSQKLQGLKNKLLALIPQNEPELPKGHIPWSRTFRGISTQTFKHFEAFYTLEDKDIIDRICFPIKDIQQKIVAFVCRHVSSNEEPRYYVTPRGRSLPLFPPRIEGSNLVLVEGIFDMLNLYDKGMRNVVCTFGTDTLRKGTKEKLIQYTALGVSKVYILFDGDEAGSTAAEFIKPLIEELDILVDIIYLDDGQDPGALSQEEVDRLIQITSK